MCSSDLAWFCDDCGALLNRQSGFSDSLGSWVCTQCGHENRIDEDEIINDGPQCPRCGSFFKHQSCYSEYDDDWTCEKCGAKLHRDYSFDPYEVVDGDNDNDDGPRCPHCGSVLKDQSYFSEYDDDWTCEECGTKLHRDFSSDPYEIVEDDDDDNDDNNDDYERYDHRTKSYDGNYRSVKTPNPIPKKEAKRIRFKAFVFHHKKIQIGLNSNDVLGADVFEAYRILQNNAFNNINLIPIKDIYTNTPYRVGQIESIQVGSNSRFVSSDFFAYDTKIVIKYHDKKEITLPFSSSRLKNKTRTEIGDRFLELGFKEIYEKPIRDLVTGWIKKDGSVERVTIDGNPVFKKKATYKFDVEIVIEYHTFKK